MHLAGNTRIPHAFSVLIPHTSSILTRPYCSSTIMSDEETKEETTHIPTKAAWTNEDEALLVHTLLQERSRGNWGDNNPKKQAWVACEAALAGSEKVTKSCHKDISAIKSRWQRVSAPHDARYMRAQGYTQLKQTFDIVKGIKTQSGWGWNEIKNVTRVSDDVWDNYVKVSVISLSSLIVMSYDCRNTQRQRIGAPSHLTYTMRWPTSWKARARQGRRNTSQRKRQGKQHLGRHLSRSTQFSLRSQSPSENCILVQIQTAMCIPPLWHHLTIYIFPERCSQLLVRREDRCKQRNQRRK